MIKIQLRGYLIRSNNETCRIPLRVDFEWDENDPVAFSMIFHQGGGVSTTWTTSYDSLTDAMTNLHSVGDGDVKFRRDISNMLFVCVKSPDGHADVALPTGPVEEFLELTHDDVDIAMAVTLPDQIDAALEEIFRGA